MSTRLALALFVPLALLAGCEMLGGESAEAMAARREAEGKAVGAACRHAGRAIEDCFGLNKRADKAAVFAGWREMNDYMRENKMEPVAPAAASAAVAAPSAASAPAATARADATADDAAGAKKPTKPATKSAS